jgi:hypothetical protein
MQAVSVGGANTKQWIIALTIVVHAGLIAAWWWAAIYADIDTPRILRQLWFPLAWAWVLWPVYALAKYRAAPLVWAALVVGGLLVAPAVSTVYAFTVWSIGGFAP